MTVDLAVEQSLALGQLVAQNRLEDGLGGVADPVELAGVDAGDPAVGSGAGVGDHEVAVQVGVAEPAGAVIEAGDDEAVALVVVEPAVASAHDGGLGFEEPDDGLLGSVDGGFDVGGECRGRLRAQSTEIDLGTLRVTSRAGTLIAKLGQR